MLEGYGLVVVGSDSGSIINDFDSVKAAVLEADLYSPDI